MKPNRRNISISISFEIVITSLLLLSNRIFDMFMINQRKAYDLKRSRFSFTYDYRKAAKVF